jgi:hypothetical protein
MTEDTAISIFKLGELYDHGSAGSRSASEVAVWGRMEDSKKNGRVRLAPDI